MRSRRSIGVAESETSGARGRGIAWEKRAERALLEVVGMLVDAPFNDLTGRIISAAIEVHRHLGPGLIESSYVDSLRYELSSQGMRFEFQRCVPATYKGVVLGSSYRLDLIVEDLVVVEAKAKERLLSVHEAQVLTYLRMTNLPVGLLINFNVPRLIDGVKRLFNPYHPVVAGLRSVP